MGNVKLLRTRALRDEAKAVRKAAAAEPAPARERILHAAEQLFAEHGMSGVGLRAISAAAKSPCPVRVGRLRASYTFTRAKYGCIVLSSQPCRL